jgi:hypothetical protein
MIPRLKFGSIRRSSAPFDLRDRLPDHPARSKSPSMLPWAQPASQLAMSSHLNLPRHGSAIHHPICATSLADGPGLDPKTPSMLPWAQPTRQLAMSFRLNSARHGALQFTIRAAQQPAGSSKSRSEDAADAALGVANKAARDELPSELWLGAALQAGTLAPSLSQTTTLLEVLPGTSTRGRLTDPTSATIGVHLLPHRSGARRPLLHGQHRAPPWPVHFYDARHVASCQPNDWR